MAREVATVFYVQRFKHLKRLQQRLRRVSRMAVLMQPLDQGLLPFAAAELGHRQTSTMFTSEESSCLC